MRGSTTCLCLLTILVAACTPGTQEMGSETDASVITSISTAELGAIVEGNFDALAAVLAEDAVYMPPGEPAVSGKAAIRSWFEGFLETVSVDGSYPSSEVDIIGDWAIERYTADVTLTPTDGSEPTREVGKGIHVYRRGADGSWKLTYDVWNFDSSPSEASDIQ